MPDLPDGADQLFWDVAPESIDLERHQNYVIERVMTHGTWTAMWWLRETYPQATLATFIRERGHRLPAREAAYWALITEVDRPATSPERQPSWSG